MDISNKSLAFLLVAAMVLSLGGTIISLNKLSDIGVTGMASGSDTGTTNLTINSSVTITFTVNNVDFGTGYTNDTDGGPTIENCTITTNGTDASSDPDCVGFNDGVSPFNIRNDGNQDVDLEINSTSTSATFFGSSNGGVYWYLDDVNEPGACVSNQVSSYTAAGIGGSLQQACGAGSDYGFLYDGTDEVELHVKVDIPQDATSGSHTMTFNAVGTSAP